MLRKIKKAAFDKLSDDLKALYSPVGNEYVLQLEDDDLEPDDGLGSTNPKLALERKHRKAAEKKAAELEIELETLRGEKETATNTSVSVKTAHDRKVAKLEKERDDALLMHKNYVGDKLKSDAATAIAGKLTKSPAIMLPHVTARLAVNYDGDEPAVVVLDAKGKPSAATFDDLQKEFRDNKDFAAIVQASQASGGRAPPPVSTAPVGSAPVPGNPQQPQVLMSMAPKNLVAQVKARQAERLAAETTA